MSDKEKEEIDNQESTESMENVDGLNDEQAQSQTEENQADEDSENSSEQDELSVVKNELEELKDKHLRLQAEFDNYRRRTLKEKAELISSAGEKVLKDLLPVIDDLDRAMESTATAQDVAAVREGLDLIVNKFQNFLKNNGVSEIEAKEQDFDADKHEAVTKFPAPSEDLKGKVIDVVQKGYTLNGKVMRFAKVVVGE
ncbi:MAG: nucleotide exchange factor GrpE [Bacteroidales bacterium]|nr:nucleotide exchange factor GrpE [Bacteroidales bacterium]MBR4689989.1 nucleotide exchange factor GrpE [Bacteroidales bacterium]